MKSFSRAGLSLNGGHLVERFFLYSVALVLSVTSFLKLSTPLPALGGAATPDPIFLFLTDQQLLLLTGCLELLVVLLLFFRIDIQVKLWLVLWMGLLFLCYRGGLQLLDYHAPCTCLGTSIGWLQLKNDTVNLLLISLLMYFVVVSSFLLAVRRKRGRTWRADVRATALPMSLSVLTIILLPTFSSSAYQYAAQGNIGVQEYKPDGTEFHKDGYDFTVWVKDSQWQIKTVFGTNWYSVTGCDGTNIYFILYDPAPKLHSPGQRINNPGLISRGTVPVDTAWYTSIPWFALASGQFFRNTNATLPTLWNLPRVDVQSHVFGIETERFADLAGLPRATKWKVELARIQKAVKSEFLRKSEFLKREGVPRSLKDNMLQEQSLIRHLKDGQVGATYTVSEYTNIGDLTIPVKFELVRNFTFPRSAPNPALSATPEKVFQRFTGTISRIWDEQLQSYLPEIKSATDVADFRFRNTNYVLDYIQYSVTNNAWPKEDDRVLAEIYQRKLSQVPKVSVYDVKHAVLLLTMFVLFISPLIVFLALHQRRKQTNQGKDRKETKE